VAFVLCLFCPTAHADEAERARATVAVELALLKTRAKAPCICQDNCKCKSGECPGKCPTAEVKTSVLKEYDFELWLVNGKYAYYPKGATPFAGRGGQNNSFSSSQSCPTGNCPRGR
jgi:hypothetical protein